VYLHDTRDFPMLATVSRAFPPMMRDFLESFTEALLKHPFENNTLVGRCVNAIKANDENHCERIVFLRSVATGIRFLDPGCPDAILSVPQVIELERRVQKTQDTSLQKAWARIRHAALELIPPDSPLHATLPDQVAPALEIRPWMHAQTDLLQQISGLNLDYLHLTSVPEEIGLLRGLHYLFIRRNHLNSIPSQVFNDMTRLLVLDLSHNDLRMLSPEALNGLTNLQSLSLEQNYLRALPQGLFSTTHSLSDLNLDHNQLESLPFRLLKKLRHLQLITATHNQLGAFDPDLFRQLRRLQTVVLSNNPLVEANPPFTSLPNGVMFISKGIKTVSHLIRVL
jgi:hypothetical protein